MKVNMIFFLCMFFKFLYIYVNIDKKIIYSVYKRYLKFCFILKFNFICMIFFSVKNLCDYELYYCDLLYIIYS